MSPSQAGVGVGGWQRHWPSPPETQWSGLVGRPGWEMGVRSPRESGGKWGEPRGDGHRLPAEDRGGRTALRLQGGARTHFSKLKSGKRMLFLMKIVKFSASIMTGLCEHRRKGQGAGSPHRGPRSLVDTAQWACGPGLSGLRVRGREQQVSRAGRKLDTTAGGYPQTPCKLRGAGPPTVAQGSLGGASLPALTFPPCPPRQGTSPGSHRCGARSCNSRSGR